MRIFTREACVKPHFTHGVMKYLISIPYFNQLTNLMQGTQRKAINT